MRKLTQEEIRWIENELLNFNIKYYEIYHEIYDHILTSVESQLELNPNSPIKDLYYHTVAMELDGYTGIQRIQKERLNLYKKKLNNQFKANLLKTITTYKIVYIPLAFTLFTLLFKIDTNSSSAIMAAGFLIAWLPDIYLLIAHSLKRKTNKQRLRIRKSLVNNYTNNISRLFYSLNVGIICILTISNPSSKNLLEHIADHSLGQLAVSAFLTFLLIISINIIQTVKKDYRNIVEMSSN